MARRHAQVLTSIWSDPDWVALPANAQRTYLLLLSQPKLTLVGLLTYTPSRWARMAADTTLDSIEAAVAELEASRFVVVDRDTDELLIRTLVRHDITSLANGTASSKLIMGFWRAWEGIESRLLRHVATHEIPDSLWDSKRGQPPPEAQRIRMSAPIELPIEPPIESLSTLHSPLETLTADNQPSSDPPPDDRQPGSPDHQHPADVFDQAIDLLISRELQRNPTRHDPERHVAAIRRGKTRDHRLAATRHLRTHPALTPDQLADLLEPPTQPTARPAIDQHQADHLAAQKARAERAARRADGTACPHCGDTGLRLDNDGFAHPCHHQLEESA